MLDQNTDRMWFVIGAVIVGAAIIFIANGTLPDVFASITSTFQQSSDKGEEVVDAITPIGANLVRYDEQESFFTINTSINHLSGELRVDSIEKVTEYMPVSAGKFYSFDTPRPNTKRVAYYREDKSYIDGFHVGSTQNWVTRAPDEAAYARIAADYKGSGSDWSNVEDWVFRQILQ